MSKILSRLVVNPKILQSLSAGKKHSVDSLNHFWDTPNFRDPIPRNLEVLSHIWADSPINYLINI